MKWLKNVIVDLLLPVIIALAVYFRTPELKVTIYVLAGLLLLIRLAALSQKQMNAALKKKKNQPPQWFFHVINGLCVVLLSIPQWWILVAMWVLIWFLSWYSIKTQPAGKKR